VIICNYWLLFWKGFSRNRVTKNESMLRNWWSIRFFTLTYFT